MGASDNSLQIGKRAPVELGVGSGLSMASVDGQDYVFDLHTDTLYIGDKEFSGVCKGVLGPLDVATQPGVAAPMAPSGDWKYRDSVDEMRGTTTHFATVQSDSILDFAFPYSGGASVTLNLRTKATSDLNVYVVVSKGQFLCSTASEDTVSVKFDSGPVQQMRCDTPDDGDATVMFISDAIGFARQLKSASKLFIEASFYQEGRKQMKFDIAGMRWDVSAGQ
jgi:hypothetical protein